MDRGIAIVTGASGGIGSAVCARLLADGFRVAAVGRREGPLIDLIKSLGPRSPMLRPVVVDLRNREEVRESFDRLGPVGVVVANAGICRRADVDDPAADEVWDEVMGANLESVWNTVRASVTNLNHDGRIVLVSSGLGKMGRAGYGAYAASKHAVLGLTKCLALELASRNISVNAVCPGWVDTLMARKDLARTALKAGRPVLKVEDEVVASIPLGRMVDPSEVASLISWLASPQCAAITGQSFNISGGEFSV